jgi:hypothetical protein
VLSFFLLAIGKNSSQLSGVVSLFLFCVVDFTGLETGELSRLRLIGDDLTGDVTGLSSLFLFLLDLCFCVKAVSVSETGSSVLL